MASLFYDVSERSFPMLVVCVTYLLVVTGTSQISPLRTLQPTPLDHKIGGKRGYCSILKSSGMVEIAVSPNGTGGGPHV